MVMYVSVTCCLTLGDDGRGYSLFPEEPEARDQKEVQRHEQV